MKVIIDFVGYCTKSHLTRGFIASTIVITAGKRFSLALVMVNIIQMNC